MHLEFKKNLSNTDRILRLLLGIVLVALWWNGTITGILGTVLLIIGISQFVEAFFSY